jgi:hypothetical protein
MEAINRLKTNLDVVLSTRGTSTFGAGGNVNVQTITDGAIDSVDFGQTAKAMIAKHSDSGAVGGSGATAAEVSNYLKNDSIGDTSYAHFIAINADSGAAGGSCDLTGIIDSARVIDSILRAMSPVLTQARDSILNLWGLLIAKFDTSFVGMGIADTSRSTSTYTTNGDTIHVFKDTREYMTLIRKHPSAYPGARPDSTEAKR